MAISDSQRRASNKYNLEHMTVLGCKVRKEEAEAFKAKCRELGTTPNAVFRSAMVEIMTGKREL